jgi:uncharacterized protein YaaR (DUF327 family)
MAKIELFNNAASFLNTQALKSDAKKAKEKEKATGVRFSNIMERITSEQSVSETTSSLPLSEETIKELLDDVHSTGDRLKNHPSPEEIELYKRAVKNFIGYVVKNGYDVEKVESGNRLKARRRYVMIQIVDNKLEELAVGILKGQKDKLKILESLEEIKGILIDLTQ